MASKVPIPKSDSIYMSPEECQKLWGSFTSASWDESVPERHRQILEERIARYCETGVELTPWEEFEKELFEQLMKG